MGPKLQTMHILQLPKPFTTFFEEHTLKTMKVEKEPQPETNAQAPEEINEDVARLELINADAATDHGDAGDDGGDAMLKMEVAMIGFNIPGVVLPTGLGLGIAVV